MVRMKNRYLLCELISHDDKPSSAIGVSTYMLLRAIQGAVHEIHGDYGVGAIRAGFLVKYVGATTNTVLIKVRHRAVKYLTSALPFVKAVQNTPCFLHTIHVAGTIRACQKYLVKHNRRHLAILYKSTKNPDDKKAVLDAIQSCSVEDPLWKEAKDDSDVDDNEDYDSDEDT